MFYDNTFYWGWGHNRYWPFYYAYMNMFQTNRTFGDTKWFYFEVKRNSTRMVLHQITDSGIVSEGRNVNLETTFSTSRQTTLN